MERMSVNDIRKAKTVLQAHDLRLDKMAIRKGYLFRLRRGDSYTYDTIILKGDDFYEENGDLKPMFWGYRLWRDVEREINGKD